MTTELLEVARRHAEPYCSQALGYPACNMKFVEGRIEHLDKAGITDESVDMVISNCVVSWHVALLWHLAPLHPL